MAKGVINSWGNRFVTITVIWSVCAVIFFCFFQMALRNSNRPAISTGSSFSNAEQRSILYAKMAKDLDENGAAFLKQGETSQSLSLSDLFTLKDGIVTPVLKDADPPVRANVLHLSTQFSIPISDAVKNIFSPYFGEAMWFQNSSMYHFSMFHASHHVAPVVATELEIEAEVVSGTDPVTIRAKLKAALPRAPQNQLYNEAMLHTSFARLLGPPKKLSEEENKLSELQIFHELVSRLNNQIRGLKATVSELWYVEEYDLLALALNGKLKIHSFNLGCSQA